MLLFSILIEFNVFAQNYPQKPVRLIVPYSPGGPVDIVGRITAQKLSEKYNIQFVVDNRAGGGGNIGASTGGGNISCTIKAGIGATGLSIVLGPDQSFTNDKAKVGDTFTVLSDWLGAGSGGASATITVSHINAVPATTADIIARLKGFATAKAVSAMKVWNDRSYRVTNADGTGACKLVAAAPGAGEMNMIATDSAGNTYYVTRLFECLAVVTQKTGSSHQFATGTRVKWSESAAVLNTSVKI